MPALKTCPILTPPPPAPPASSIAAACGEPDDEAQEAATPCASTEFFRGVLLELRGVKWPTTRDIEWQSIVTVGLLVGLTLFVNAVALVAERLAEAIGLN